MHPTQTAAQMGNLESELARLRKECARWRQIAGDACNQSDALRDLNAELLAALEPFDQIGGWLFARQEVPDDTPMVTFEGLNNYRPVLTRGHFKAASIASRKARGEA